MVNIKYDEGLLRISNRISKDILAITKSLDNMRKEMENPKKCNDLDSSCCKVCGEKANNFVAYGGKSCGCCRQFFRRTVVKMSR